ncbi:eiger [Carabus blaptoides fortunei]
MYYVLNKNNEIQQLQELVNTLTSDVNKLKFQYLDDDLVDEIKAFGNEAYSDSDSNDDSNTDDADDEDEWTSYLDDDDIPEHKFDVNKFMKILNGDYDTSENPIRSKRELLSATIDGVPIIAESYSERKRNKTLVTNADGLKLYESLGKKSTGEPPKVKHHYSGVRGWTSRTYVHSRDLRPASPTPVMTRSSRVMHTNEDKSKAFRSVVKKSLLKSSAPEPTARVFQEQVLAPEATVTREGTTGHRRRKHGSRANLETMDHPRAKRNMVLVHFHGDTSKYVYGQHQHYKNNGHLAHPEGRYVDWAPSNWVQTLGMDRHFQMNNGVLTIKDAGLYFVYAQIFYQDEHDTNGYKIVQNDRELIAQCTTMTHSERPVSKSNTCYTATVHYLAENDRVSLKDVENLRYSLFEDGKSFFGLLYLHAVGGGSYLVRFADVIRGDAAPTRIKPTDVGARLLRVLSVTVQ